MTRFEKNAHKLRFTAGLMQEQLSELVYIDRSFVRKIEAAQDKSRP